MRQVIRKEYVASVTVFFSLIFLLVLALVLTSIESARIHAGKAYVNMNLSCATDSVFGNYYLPLFEEYGLFGLYQEERTQSERSDNLKNQIIEQLEYSRNPFYGVENKAKNCFYLFPWRRKNLETKNPVYLTENQGEHLYLQAVQQMEYIGFMESAKAIAKKCNGLKEQKSCAKAYEMIFEAEEQFVDLELIVIELMQLIDGIKIESNLFGLDGQIELSCAETFVKQYVEAPMTKDTIKINHTAVYQQMEDRYIDKSSLYKNILEDMTLLIENIPILEQLIQEQQELIEQQESKGQDKIEEQGEIKEQQKINEREKERKKLEDLKQQIRILSERNLQLKDSINQSIESIQNQFYDLRNILESTEDKLSQAILLKEDAQDGVSVFEKELKKLEGNLPERFYDSLSDDTNKMRGYEENEVQSSLGLYDFQKMLQTVVYDKDIVTGQIHFLEDFIMNDNITVLQEQYDQIKELAAGIGQYRIDDLEFDYSTLNLNPREDNLLKSLKDLKNSSILDVVLKDSAEVSKVQISSYDLPSTMDDIRYKSFGTEIIGNFIHLIKDMFDENQLKSYMEMYTGLFTDTDLFMEALEAAKNATLFQMYINYYFKSYIVEEDFNAETVYYPSRLQYEKEYICFQHTTDQENLVATIETIAFFRFIGNFISLLSDETCKNKASGTATTLVAFTGLTFLVQLVQYTILMIWAYMESLVDVAILLRGKSVPILEFTSHHLKYEELIDFDKTIVQKKAEIFKENREHAAMSYNEYLYLFLFLRSRENKCYSVMDLVQENLRLRYDEQFSMMRCLVGVDVDLTYHIPNLFITGYEQLLQRNNKVQIRFHYMNH